MKMLQSSNYPSVIICYHGASNKGKTTVLNFLIDVLSILGLWSLVRRYTIHGRDRKAVCEYNETVIGIGTQGDSKGAIIKNIEFFIAQKASIVVIASHDDSSILKKDSKIYQ